MKTSFQRGGPASLLPLRGSCPEGSPGSWIRTSNETVEEQSCFGRTKGCQKNTVLLLRGPIQSPDLNPPELLWNHGGDFFGFFFISTVRVLALEMKAPNVFVLLSEAH